MINRCRPDFEIHFLSEVLNKALCSPLEKRQRLERFGGRKIFPVPSAREGLLWFLKRVGIGTGDEVTVPTLICEAVVDSIMACGAKPVTYGVSGHDFSPSVSHCEKSLSKLTKAVIVPHLYGIPANLRDFRSLCRSRRYLLIEDCAPCVYGRNFGYRVGSVGDCSIYSFKYDKPISLGWGGAVSLSTEMLSRVGPPEFPMLSLGDDELITASFLLQHFLTSSRRYSTQISNNFALKFLLRHEELVPELFSSLREEPNDLYLTQWCDKYLTSASNICQSKILTIARRYIPPRVRQWRTKKNMILSRFGGRCLPSSGLAHQMLAIQDIELQKGLFGTTRAKIANVYKENLDRRKMIVPSPDCSSSHWLRFPISLRNDKLKQKLLSTRLMQECQVEISDSNWNTPIHRIPRFERIVRVGSGTFETEQLVKGLLNLPVHGEMSEEKAQVLCSVLNEI
jgi:dTDP-4-amino-4,6-dideoxygalactose transaminase